MEILTYCGIGLLLVYFVGWFFLTKEKKKMMTSERIEKMSLEDIERHYKWGKRSIDFTPEKFKEKERNRVESEYKEMLRVWKAANK